MRLCGPPPHDPGTVVGTWHLVRSNQMQKRYFPNPVPDNFHTGNPTKHPEAGLMQDYYAWE